MEKLPFPETRISYKRDKYSLKINAHNISVTSWMASVIQPILWIQIPGQGEVKRQAGCHKEN